MRQLFAHGWHGWVLVIAVMVAWDIGAIWAKGETITAWTRNAGTHPLGRWLLFAVFGYVLVHLLIPGTWPTYDPLDRLYALIRDAFRRAQR
jgi:hypothetical protein